MHSSRAFPMVRLESVVIGISCFSEGHARHRACYTTLLVPFSRMPRECCRERRERRELKETAAEKLLKKSHRFEQRGSNDDWWMFVGIDSLSSIHFVTSSLPTTTAFYIHGYVWARCTHTTFARIQSSACPARDRERCDRWRKGTIKVFSRFLVCKGSESYLQHFNKAVRTRVLLVAQRSYLYSVFRLAGSAVFTRQESLDDFRGGFIETVIWSRRRASHVAFRFSAKFIVLPCWEKKCRCGQVGVWPSPQDIWRIFGDLSEACSFQKTVLHIQYIYCTSDEKNTGRGFDGLCSKGQCEVEVLRRI